jgi:hypothetical protein
MPTTAKCIQKGAQASETVPGEHGPESWKDVWKGEVQPLAR